MSGVPSIQGVCNWMHSTYFFNWTILCSSTIYHPFFLTSKFVDFTLSIIFHILHFFTLWSLNWKLKTSSYLSPRSDCIACDWMRYSEIDCSVTRIAKLNAMLWKWLVLLKWMRFSENDFRLSRIGDVLNFMWFFSISIIVTVF